jgi:hypothetical protein
MKHVGESKTAFTTSSDRMNTSRNHGAKPISARTGHEADSNFVVFLLIDAVLFNECMHLAFCAARPGQL